MPIDGFTSLCSAKASTIISQDRGNPQKYIAHNKDKSQVNHYKIDGVVIREGQRCDFALFNEDKRVVYLIELKGSDLEKAAAQLEATRQALAEHLSSYATIEYRIVANKCRTHSIQSTNFKRYCKTWAGHFKYATAKIEENI